MIGMAQQIAAMECLLDTHRRISESHSMLPTIREWLDSLRRLKTQDEDRQETENDLRIRAEMLRLDCEEFNWKRREMNRFIAAMITLWVRKILRDKEADDTLYFVPDAFTFTQDDYTEFDLQIIREKAAQEAREAIEYEQRLMARPKPDVRRLQWELAELHRLNPGVTFIAMKRGAS